MQTGAPPWPSVLRTAARLLTFRATREEFLAFGPRHLALGLAATWLVGIGRYWDHPSAHPLQYAGLGSLAVASGLALVLWIVVKPMRPAGMTFLNLWTFVTLCAPLAALYAVPVERFMPLPTATAVNGWFLAVVAAWRVALLVFYLRRLCRLTAFRTAVATLLPITAVVATLALLNLERAVFEVMAGDTPGTSRDAAYAVVLLLAFLSLWILPFTALSWLVIVVREQTAPQDPAPPSAAPADPPNTFWEAFRKAFSMEEP